jgi:hypothetical protein
MSCAGLRSNSGRFLVKVLFLFLEIERVFSAKERVRFGSERFDLKVDWFLRRWGAWCLGFRDRRAVVRFWTDCETPRDLF